MTTEDEMRTYLGQYAEMIRKMHAENNIGEDMRYHSVEELVLDQGTFFHGQELPEWAEQDAPQECYSNAFFLALDLGYRYFEGVGSTPFFPVAHAWVVDPDDNVIDTTWDDPQDRIYCGIEIPVDVVRAIIEETGYYGIYGNDWLRGSPILKTGIIEPTKENA